MPITALPTPPSRQDPTNFNDRADAFLGALPLFQTEANALQTNVNTSEVNAVNSAAAVLAATNIVKWVSGTTYANGAVVWSPINGLGYRRITASGSGTTDPSADTTNYKQVNGTGDVSTSGNQTIAGVKTFSSNIVGNLTGNADTATSATTAASCSGNAATATNAATVTTITTSQVLNATAAANHQDIGTMTIAWNTTSSGVASNGTIAGSSLRYTSASVNQIQSPANMFTHVSGFSTTFPHPSSTTALTGTWKNMGGFCRGRWDTVDGDGTSIYFWYASLWLRIA